ncbi:ABC transporter permease [Tyzzerella sp. An114]|uniref:ABC transporter permease n=1 Tax=Tyzzerella sp. An114 TaxID=1965545 RepID=UPI000B4519C8|nr:ABC transporter permease [Tyzzerella sp. An114]
MMTIKYIIKNLIRMITLLVAVTIFSFILVTSSPIDPVQSYVGAGVAVTPEQREEIAEHWGLNDKPIERFENWFENIIKGDMGTSLIYRKPVSEVIGEKFQSSMILMITSWIISGILGFVLGIIMGVFKGSFVDRIIKTICLVISSTPTFWIGMMFLMIFSVNLGWFPTGFSVPVGVSADSVTIGQKIYHAILPAITLSFSSFSNIALHTRIKITEIMESDYVLFAKARGEKLIDIIKRHVLRNALIPAVTLQFASISEIFGGSILAEQVFSYPGMGQAAVDAGLRGDIALLLGITIISSIFVFVGNIIANILYTVLNPKIREGGVYSE